MEGRRRFILKGAALVAAGAAASVDAPVVHAQSRFQWRMSTAWLPNLDLLLASAHRFARIVDEMSGGRLKIQVHAGGEILATGACFEACSQGTIEAFFGSSHYWTAKDPGFLWFSKVPFGLNGQGMMSWLLYGDGLKLWEEGYAPFNLLPRPGPSTGMQMAGWFRKKLGSPSAFKDLKMRIQGIGGKILGALGTIVVLTQGNEIIAALEKGVIDAAEWVGPYDDIRLGLPAVARYYYYPSWHEPGSTTELTFNRRAYEALPSELRYIVEYACQSVQVTGLAEYEQKNAAALGRLRTEFKGKVEILPLSSSTLKELRRVSDQVLRDESEKSPVGRKAYASMGKFQAQNNDWRLISEAAYQTSIAPHST
jgi:TRAP-type mannitol/chloroaromatic compound transport system substrate-binding protein